MKTHHAVFVLCVTAFVPALLSAEAVPSAGKKIYDAKCAGCHGKDGKGNAAMAKALKTDAAVLDLTSPSARQKSDEDILKIILEGKNKMPPSKQLTADDQKAVLDYAKSLSGTKPPAEQSAEKSESSPAAVAVAAPAAFSAEAQKDYAKSCASCHGKDGKGSAAMAKVFKVDPAALDLVDDDSLGKSDADHIRIIADGLNKMPAYKGKISDKIIAEIVAYYRSLKPAK